MEGSRELKNFEFDFNTNSNSNTSNFKFNIMGDAQPQPQAAAAVESLHIGDAQAAAAEQIKYLESVLNAVGAGSEADSLHIGGQGPGQGQMGSARSTEFVPSAGDPCHVNKETAVNKGLGKNSNKGGGKQSQSSGPSIKEFVPAGRPRQRERDAESDYVIGSDY